MTTIDTAPVPEDGDTDCKTESCDGTIRLYDGDRVCDVCGRCNGGGNPTRGGAEAEADEWDEWFEHRDELYSGFTGRNRIKMVGGFAAPYLD